MPFSFDNGDFFRRKVVKLIDRLVDFGFEARDGGRIWVREDLIYKGDDGGFLRAHGIEDRDQKHSYIFLIVSPNILSLG
jgi:hypothetical protein